MPGPLLPPAWDEELVVITNSHPVPARFTRARVPIQIRARIGWDSGPEVIETLAVAWTSQLVLVQLGDKRCQFRGVWLAASDVQRMPSAVCNRAASERGDFD